MTELANQTSAVGVKGAVGRARVTGQFFLRVSQSISMSPTSPLPQRDVDLAGVSMLSYLEKFGGFGQNRELGLIMWSWLMCSTPLQKRSGAQSKTIWRRSPVS